MFDSGAVSDIPSDVVDEALTDEMNEFMAAEGTPLEVEADEAMPAEVDAAQEAGVVVTQFEGTFGPRSHPGEGVAKVLNDGTEQRFLRFEDFATDNGPDLNVYLTTADADADAGDFGASGQFVDLGDLKGNIGEQNYEIPPEVDLEQFDTVVIWCVRFGVAFAAADLATGRLIGGVLAASRARHRSMPRYVGCLFPTSRRQHAIRSRPEPASPARDPARDTRAPRSGGRSPRRIRRCRSRRDRTSGPRRPQAMQGGTRHRTTRPLGARRRLRPVQRECPLRGRGAGTDPRRARRAGHVRRPPCDERVGRTTARSTWSVTAQRAVAERATGSVSPTDPRIERARALLADGRKQAKRWRVPDGYLTLIDGLDTSYRRGRSALRHVVADPTDDGVHEWRKAVKQLWYQIRLLEMSAPSVLEPLSSTLDGLAEALGDDHDLTVLIERIRDDPVR